ncbi:MAG TPA: hypothetical protein VE130_14735 [Nitrososphaeraceae archaeon]|jgi:rRNA processing protein Gar1|nr:hypothetical protein [Nitrososphaeraceae archaeon]
MKQPNGTDWQKCVNSPVYTVDGKEIGFVSSIQPDNLVVVSGPISPDKFLIPKSSVRGLEAGTVYLDSDSTFISNNYQFE